MKTYPVYSETITRDANGFTLVKSEWTTLEVPEDPGACLRCGAGLVGHMDGCARFCGSDREKVCPRCHPNDDVPASACYVGGVSGYLCECHKPGTDVYAPSESEVCH